MEPHSPSVVTLCSELPSAVASEEEQHAPPMSGDGKPKWSPEESMHKDTSETQEEEEKVEKEEEEILDFSRGQDLEHITQAWQDGCMYQGTVGLDMKLGYGRFSWPTGEIYRGQFYHDHRHGVGTYTWPDGSSFTGTFYLSSREGYGTMDLKLSLFQGLYKADRRFGPGIETYPDGSQDVGLWFQEHLVQLCTQAPGGFSIQDHQEYSSFLSCAPPRGSISEEQGPEEAASSQEEDPFSYAYKQLLMDDSVILPPDMGIYSTDSCHLPLPYSLRQALDACMGLGKHDQSMSPSAEGSKPWPIKNETPLLVRMQKHAYKFRNKPAHSQWRMDAILVGDRSGFGQAGPKEQLSMELILKAKEGDYAWMCHVLRDKRVSPDVADSRGYTALASAAVNSHMDIVKLLLDFGADVNKLSDEGLTPLAMCALLYYPAWAFKHNVAERTLALASPVHSGRVSLSMKDPPKLSVTSVPDSTLPILDMVLGPSSREESEGSQEAHLVPPTGPTEGSVEGMASTTELTWESSELWSSAQGWSSSFGGSLSDLEREQDARSGHLDQASSFSLFESNLCVRNLSLELSRGLLERGALAFCGLQHLPGHQAVCTQGGALWRMAMSMVEQRSRWLTICLLLRRGADPNLSCVPMPVLFLAVKAGDVDGVRMLLENGARTDIQFPPEHRSLTPLHIAVALPGEEGIKITELLLNAITNVDARANDMHETCKPRKLTPCCHIPALYLGTLTLGSAPNRDSAAPVAAHTTLELDLMMSTMKLNGELGPPSNYYKVPASGADSQGGRTPLHVACEREDDQKHVQDVVRLLLSHKANPNMLWSGHSPLSLAIVSGNDLIVKELLIHGADPNLLLTRGLGSALCVVCDINYESYRNLEGKLALVDRLISYGADILNPVTLVQGDKVAVGTAVDYGHFRFFQDRRIAHSAFHTLMPHERDTLVARKRLLDYMGFLLRSAVLAKEGQWDPQELYLSKRGAAKEVRPLSGASGIQVNMGKACLIRTAELIHYHRLRRKSTIKKLSGWDDPRHIPFFKFCYQCGRSVGVRLVPCVRCYGVLTCSKFCKGRFWVDVHKKECSELQALGNQRLEESDFREDRDFHT